MFKAFHILIFCFVANYLNAQQYFIKQYRVESGLPSDIIKACAQDSLGFLWIATDEGLVKYDGIKFTTHREAMHSSFIKGFLKTKAGKLITYGDLDLVEINNLGDTVIFKSLCPVARTPDDSTLSYPKTLYEDRAGKFWVSESQSVVKLDKQSFKRYDFGLINRTPQYLRSFQFFEDKANNLYMASFSGNVFRYDSIQDTFSTYATDFPKDIEFASVIDDHLILGTSVGVFEANVLSQGGFEKPKLKFKIARCSYVARMEGDEYFIATRDMSDFVADFKKNTFSPISQEITNINHVFVSAEKDLWVSGNDGLILIKKNLFREASAHLNQFIESIAQDLESGKIYYASNSLLFSFDPITKKNQKITEMPYGYFQSLLPTREGLWFANAFSIYLYSKGEVKKKFDLSKDGLFITNIKQDRQQNIWLTRPGNPDIYLIDKEQKLRKSNLVLDKNVTVNLICQGPNGLYIASTGKSSYLFFKPDSEDKIENLSLPVNFETHGDFNVTDLAFVDNKIWMATSEGLLKYDGKNVTQVEIDETFKDMPVKSVKAFGDKKLFLSNGLGLILYDINTGAYDLFNESSGLLSNTITPHGLFIDKDGSIWIGTSEGLCYSTKSLTSSMQTPRLLFIDVKANGKSVHLKPETEFDYGSFLLFVVSSITFPEKEVKTEYKFENENQWHTAKGAEINFSVLSPGKYVLQVRTKKNGPYEWSKISKVNFRIAYPFWRQNWFYFLLALMAVSFLFFTIFIANLINKKRNEGLQLLIDKRTKELQKANNELAQRNNELDRFVYSASHDLSAPLKSILGLILIAKLEKPSESMDNYLDLMKRSILKLESFIKDIISFSRNTRIEVKKEPINFDDLIQSIWTDLLFAPDAEKIKFNVINGLKSPLVSDETRLRIVFNNLLSNAIKFRSKDRDSFIHVSASNNPDSYEFTIEDNGIGISNEYIDKIFEMFFRATETVQGSGLGLYILKETLSKLGGTIVVESEVDRGTTFKIKLPK